MTLSIDTCGVVPHRNDSLPGIDSKNHAQVHPLFMYLCLIQKPSMKVKHVCMGVHVFS